MLMACDIFSGCVVVVGDGVAGTTLEGAGAGAGAGDLLVKPGTTRFARFAMVADVQAVERQSKHEPRRAENHTQLSR